MKKILCFIDFYLPGYKSGGSAKTLQNIVNSLYKNYEFYIITRDHDLNSNKIYDEIDSNNWNLLFNAKIKYLSDSSFSFNTILNIIKSNNFDLIYLNSFFSPKATIQVIIANKYFINSEIPILIAPRGELSMGALSIKKRKKSIYIFIANIFNLYKNIKWQASSFLEENDIKNNVNKKNIKIFIAQDIISNIFHLNNINIKKSCSPLNLVFYSRIAKVKNLHFLLNALFGVIKPINLDIYGPIEDSIYWENCSLIISNLPTNIKVTYRGSIQPQNVINTLSFYDVFFFPTTGENFGHVIYESLCSGVPVILSDKTSWNADNNGAVQLLSINDTSIWTYNINKWTNYTEMDINNYKHAAHNYIRELNEKNNSIETNIIMFNSCIYQK